MAQPAIKAFVSYSHSDEEMRQKLEIVIRASDPAMECEVWDDRQLTAGDAVHEEILAAIARADVFFALISYAYLASDYCKREMREALAAAKARRCRPGLAEYIDLLQVVTRLNPGDSTQQEQALGELRQFVSHKQGRTF